MTTVIGKTLAAPMALNIASLTRAKEKIVGLFVSSLHGGLDDSHSQPLYLVSNASIYVSTATQI